MTQPRATAFPVRRPMTYLTFAAAVTVGVFLVFAQRNGDAQEVDCDTIQKFVEQTGEVPQFTIDPDTDSVVVTTSKGNCRESTAQWSKRNWQEITRPKSSPGRRPSQTQSGAPEQPQKPALPPAASQALPPMPGQSTSPETFSPRAAQPHPAGAGQPPPSGASAGKEPPLPRAPGECIPLTDVWKPGDVTIRGRRYMIARAFTIDNNGDNVVDDVGFRVESKSGQVFDMRYFPRPGSLSAKEIDGLGLHDDSVIKRLCFGSVDLLAGRPLEPRPAANQPPPQAFKVPDLAKEYAEVKSGKAPAQAPPKDSSPVIGRIVFAGGVAGGIIVIAGVGLFFTRHMWLPKPKHADDEEGDEDEDGEEADRGRDAAEDDEEDEEDDEQPKKKKKKRGLFGRK